MHNRRDTTNPKASDETMGVFLLLVSAIAFSTTGLFTRLAPVTPLAMMLWRNLFGCLSLAGFVASGRCDVLAEWRGMGRAGWAAVVCSAASMTCYLLAFSYTSVASIAIIYATAPMMTAILARMVLGESLSLRTMSAAGTALVGVIVTMGGATSPGAHVGDGLALLMTFGLSTVAVLTRGNRVPPLPTAMASAALVAAVALPCAALLHVDLRVGTHDAVVLAVFGATTIALAWPASLAGMARVPAARAMLISSFELPLGPLWVWLVCDEKPAPAALMGGALVLVAVLAEIRPASSGPRIRASTSTG